MVLWLRHRRLLWSILVALATLLLTLLLTGRQTRPTVVGGELSSPGTVIVLDAGHGGEDGGAVAADGTETTLLDDGESDTISAALVPDGETLRVYAVPKGQENAVSVWYDLSERSPRVES